MTDKVDPGYLQSTAASHFLSDSDDALFDAPVSFRDYHLNGKYSAQKMSELWIEMFEGNTSNNIQKYLEQTMRHFQEECRF